MTDQIIPADKASPLARMDADRLSGLLSFLQAAEQLKDTLRSGTTRKKRPESTAEHTWRLALMVLVFERELEGLDLQRLIKLCLIHDLGEAISGDVPAPSQRQDDDRQERERRDFETLCAPLPKDMRDHLMALWLEYAAAETAEAQLAKAFDKLETMLQHLLMPPGDVIFYEFNLTYGRERTDFSPLTRQIRDLVDNGTRQIMEDLQNAASRT
ncbi:HD domain-containing protein [Roseibium porphyridii]|uniref:5'-deoxynucleotidase n=1 Tax=Roseibium porphyridii TaxID=2866279 RepID=A0ABY8EYY6_9HYPH|nr:HD domain-containing protein [Roseibium sp. KMA01]WFE88244.1 HD domain-containing protein [Roseibium sp. KMA01]